MAEKEYYRLTLRRARTTYGLVSTSRASLWMGKDHLLCMDYSGFTETYKRFYFRDIQAVIVRKTIEWHVISVVLALIVGFLALMAVVGNSAGINTPLAWFFGSVGGLVGLLLVFNII